MKVITLQNKMALFASLMVMAALFQIHGVDAFAITPTPTPLSLELPLNSMATAVEYSDEKLDQGLKPRVIILLDSSGSMGQLMDKKKSKMFYSKKLFNAYLQDQWREKADVGMIVYGSRKKRDCSDYYFAIPLGEKNLSKIDSTVRKLSPLGMTPIAASLDLAIKNLKDYPGPKRVMIFTDGEETCGGNSCKTLEKAIQEKVFDLEMFVTGIGLEKNSKDLDKLRCLGKVFGAPNPEALKGALSAISNDISHGKGGKAYTSNNLYVQCPDPHTEVRVFSVMNGKKTYVKSFTAVDGVKLPPGDYAAEVMMDPIYAFKPFKIMPKKTVTLKVIGQGLLNVKFMDGLLEVEILDNNKKVIQNFLSDEPQLVKSGVYDIRISGGSFFERYEKGYKIIPGAKHEISVDEAGVVLIEYPSTVGIHVFNSSGADLGNQLTNFPFVLKTGSYRFFVNEHCNIDGIQVRNEKTVKTLTCAGNPK